MIKEKPLWERMYRDDLYIEIVRTIGYRAIRYAEAQEILKPIVDRFGESSFKAAASALTILIFKGEHKRSGRQQDAEVCLNDEARKLAWQLLGPPPEHPEAEHFKCDKPWTPPWARPQPKGDSPKEGKPKRTRKKKAS